MQPLEIPVPSAMNMIYLFLLAILLMAYVRTLARVKAETSNLTPALGWMIGIGYFLIVPLTVITLGGGYHSPPEYDINGWGDVDLSNTSLLKPFLVIWSALLFACIATGFFIRSSSCSGQSQIVTRKQLEPVLRKSALLALCGWGVMIYMVGGVEAFLASHWYSRVVDLTEEHGAAFLLFDHVTEANLIVFTGAAALYTSLGLRHRDTSFWKTVLLLAFLGMGMVMSGNRVFAALYFVSLLTSAWLFNRKKILVSLLLLIPVAGILSGTWAAVRHDLTDISGPSSEHFALYNVKGGALRAVMDATEGTDVTLLLHMIDDFGGKYPTLWGATYGRIFTFFLPRSIYPSRTPDFTTLSASLYEPGGQTSLASTVAGEAYANCGFLAVFILPIWSGLACRLTRVVQRQALAGSVLFISTIWFVRGTFAESAVLAVTALALIRVLGSGIEASSSISLQPEAAK